MHHSTIALTSASLSRPNAVKHVHLDGNSLAFISEILLPWDEVEMVELGKNPWRCDCDLLWIFDRKERNISSIIFDDYMLCDSPERLNGLPMKYLTAVNLNCDEGNENLIQRVQPY